MFKNSNDSSPSSGVSKDYLKNKNKKSNKDDGQNDKE